MQTSLTYFENSYQFSAAATILSGGRDENGWYITLSHTVFYPQGGGQPCDVGSISVRGETVPIHAVKWVGEEVRHYVNQEPENYAGQPAVLAIDQVRRVYNSRLHSAGHLLKDVVEKTYPHWKAFKGHHYSEGAYVEFMGQEACLDLVNLEILNTEIKNTISQDLSISSVFVSPERLQEFCPLATHNNSNNIRLVCIEGFSYQPCGGTHVHNVRELAGLAVLKQKLKGNTLRISYAL